MSAGTGTAAWALAEAFERSPLCPSAVRQTALCARWAERGAVLRERLLARLEPRLVTAATTSVAPAWSAAAQAHALGLGAAAYHYLAAPCGAPAREARHAREAETAGALTQLVVAFYDHLLDEGLLRQPLPAASFTRALTGAADDDDAPHPAARLVLALTAEWGQLVRTVGERDPAGAAHLLGLAERMAAVEAATVGGWPAGTTTTTTAEQRARLPFEAVGAIARLGPPASASDLADWHADWCGRVGAALGLVDDVVDLEQDLAAGRVNTLADVRVDPDEIVAALERLHEEWRGHTDATAADEHAETLGMLTRSWLAASMHERDNRQLTTAPAE